MHTKEEIAAKWGNHLAGKLTIFAFSGIKGPALEDRMTKFVLEVMDAVTRCVEESYAAGSSAHVSNGRRTPSERISP